MPQPQCGEEFVVLLFRLDLKVIYNNRRMKNFVYYLTHLTAERLIIQYKENFASQMLLLINTLTAVLARLGAGLYKQEVVSYIL